MTKQTDSPLEILSLNHTNRPAVALVEMYRRGELLLDTPYQRGSVWTNDQQVELIRSFLEGLPTGNLTINNRLTAAWNFGDPYVYSVIDGKQRLLALTKWFEGDLEVPSSWFKETDYIPSDGIDTEDGTYLTYPNLSESRRRILNNRFTVGVAEASVATLKEEAEIFVRLNSGGTLQLEDTMEKARQISSRVL